MNTDTASASTQFVATEHGNCATTTTVATKHNSQFAATEHMTESVVATTYVVCLTLVDAEELRRHEATIKPPRYLHNFAQYTHTAISMAGTAHVAEHTGNLDTWFPWKAYIAHHKTASDIIGPSVTHAATEFIQNTKDPNRGGQTQLDFVVCRSDGTQCRLHPSPRAANDATSVLSSVFAVQSLATEQTRSPCRWSELPPNPFHV